jgi:hypothetical protein
MILSLTAPFGTSISLDFRRQLGEPVELQAFHFVTPRLSFACSAAICLCTNGR